MIECSECFISLKSLYIIFHDEDWCMDCWFLKYYRKIVNHKIVICESPWRSWTTEC